MRHFLIILFTIIGHSIFGQPIIRYVSQSIGTPTGDGLSWATASSDLQAMLNEIPNLGTIKLEIGTYKPTSYPSSCIGCTYDRDYAFYTDKNVTIQGGYVVGATYPTMEPHLTVLSGDIGVMGNTADDVHHVIISSNASGYNHLILEQLSVINGNANSGGSVMVGGMEILRNNGGGIYANKGVVELRYVFLHHLLAYDSGGAIYGKNVVEFIVKKSLIRNNSAIKGGAIYLINDSYQHALLEKSVIVNNIASQGGALYLSDPPKTSSYTIYDYTNVKINYCTFFGNISPDGSVLYSPNDVFAKLVFANSIVHGNDPNIYNFGGAALPASNTIVQGSMLPYPSIRNEQPVFHNTADLDGLDNIWMTEDDGLIPMLSGKAALANIGAYLWNQTYCSSSSILYVDINNPSPGNGTTWATALNDLNHALNLARRCENIQEIHVAKGTYNPQYNWYVSKYDYPFYEHYGTSYDLQLISPSEMPMEVSSSTFILKPGLEVYGGYPTGGGIRDPLTNPTLLTGVYGSIVSIHEVNHNANNKTILDGFIIKDGFAPMYERSRDDDLIFSKGGGIRITSDYVKVNGNIFKDNKALKASAIYAIGSHIEISNNEFTGHTTSPSNYFLFTPKGSLINIDGDSNAIHHNNMFNNLLGNNSIILDVKGRYNEMAYNDINSNASLPIFLQAYKSKCFYNHIKNGIGDGIMIAADSSEIAFNNIENNSNHGIFIKYEVLYLPEVTENLIVDDGYSINVNYYGHIHDNVIKANQGSGIFVEGTSDATVEYNIIIDNLINGIEGASKMSYNTITNNSQGIACDSAIIHHNVINKNMQGISGTKCHVYNNYMIDNDAAMTIALGKIYNNVLVSNVLGDLSGGIIIHNDNMINTNEDECHIVNNTFYGNVASNPNGAGAIFIDKFKGDTVEINNNIFYQNANGIFTTVPKADFAYNKLFVDFPPIFKNNMLQLSSASYTGATNNALGSGSSSNIFNSIPTFISITDLDGLDNLYMTKDDGLVLADLSSGLDGGLDKPILDLSSTDISGIPRILGLHTDIGAYEKINCVTLDTIFVDKHHIHTTGGSGWRSAILDLDVALWLAHECSNVAVINVSADEYMPKSKPYEMQASTKGVEISTADDRDKTFHIRTGVNLYGGFIVNSDTAYRDPVKFRTVLNGRLADTSVIHTVMISYNKNYWTDPLDTTVIDGFNIIGGRANNMQELTVNGNIMNKSHGGGMIAYGGTNKIAHCTVKDNYALTGGGIYLDTDTSVISQSLLTNNLAMKAAGASAVNSKCKFISNTIVNNTADTSAAILIKNANGHFINNLLSNNQSTEESGGLSIHQGNLSLVNNTFFENKSNNTGALYIDGGVHFIANSIFNRNRKNNLYNVIGSDYSHSSATLTTFFNNCNMQLNDVSNYTAAALNDLGSSFSNVFNINPIFYDTLDIDGVDNFYGTFDDGMRLLVGSPMINVGKNAAIPTYITTDIFGSPRIQRGTVDIGAYEGGNVRCPEGLFDTLFVDQTMSLSGNGSSWSQAFKTLDEAIFITHMCPYIKYICVAEGTYYPSAKPYNMQHYRQGIEIETTEDRDKTFHLRDGVVLLGGYKKSGTERNVNSYPTILDGDIWQDGSAYAYHTAMMVASPYWNIRYDTTIIDGCTIKNGVADNTTHQIMVNNSHIESQNGGGIFIVKGYQAIKNSQIEKNTATQFGGGIFCKSSKSSNCHNNTFYLNSSKDGGGIYANQVDQFSIGYNAFVGNEATKYGGGIFIDSSDNVIHHDHFKNNSANFGAGIYAKGRFHIQDGDFIGNNTLPAGKGGAIFTTKSHGKIDRCLFDGNLTDLHGGGLYTYLCDSIFVWNSVFFNNKATNMSSLGGAIYNDKNDHYEQINCTTYGNVANSGGGLFVNSNNPILKNNILYDTNPISILTGSMTLTHSIIKGGHPLCTACPGSLGDIDPLFINDMDVDGADNTYRTADDGLNVISTSPAIDKGTSYRIMPHDITYQLREWGYRDIGAYELFQCPTNSKLYVDQIVLGGKGSAWSDAVHELSTALYVAHTCPVIDEIFVAKGTYKPQFKPFEMKTNQKGKELYTPYDHDMTFHIRSGLNLIGGYKSSGTDRNTTVYPSVLDGNISSSSDDVRHVVLAASSPNIWLGNEKVTLDGFHIRNGHSQSYHGLMVNGKSIDEGMGAGIYCDYPGTTILNDNKIIDNLGQGIYMKGGQNEISFNKMMNNLGSDGGGAFFTKGINTINDNEISDNEARQGGGLSFYQDTSLLINNNIHDNTTSNDWGGGIYAEKGKIQLKTNTINKNQSRYGGGAYFKETTVRIDSNQIISNQGILYGGGGMQLDHCTGRLYKNTFTSNYSQQHGGGIGIVGGTIDIESNLFHKNKAMGNGGGIVLGSVNSLLINNVFCLDTANGGSAVQVYYGWNKIVNNTFYKNEGAIHGGAFASGLGNNEILNNIFYQNTKNGNAAMVGADYYNDVFNPANNIFDNNAMQFEHNNYNSTNNNAFYYDRDNLYNTNPQFNNVGNILGPDMHFGTSDDGLTLSTSSSCINIGEKQFVPDSIALDAKHQQRVVNYQVDLGAYETFRDPCLAHIMYVDSNSIIGGIGNSWASAFRTISEALYVAHKCPTVDTILIAEGTYFPELMPFQMDATMVGQEIISEDVRNKTFHLRQGLTLIGGYPPGGDETPSSSYKVILKGRKNDSSYPVYHVILMDTSAMWTSMNKLSSVQYCTIKDGFAVSSIPDSILVNGQHIINTRGAGIYVNGSKATLRYNDIAHNDGDQGAGIYLSKASEAVLASNQIHHNNATELGGGIKGQYSKIIMYFNNLLMNTCISPALRGMMLESCTGQLQSSNTIDGMRLHNGKIEVIGLNTIKP